MDWKKINAYAIMEVLRLIDEKSLRIAGKNKVIYSDGKEELIISYRRLKECSQSKDNK